MKQKIFLIAAIVLFAALVASILTGGFGLTEKIFPKNAKAIAEKTVKFVNENLLQEGTQANLKDSNCLQKVGLCKFTVEVNSQSFDSYVSDDGKLLFTEAIDMAKATAAQSSQPSTPQNIPKGDRPEVKLYVMSYCPYGIQAEDLMIPAVNLLGGKVDFKLGYVIYSDYAKKAGGKATDYCLDETEKYCSMHGRNELDQDVRALCVQKYMPEKLWQFVAAINQNTSVSDVADKWSGIAASLGINVQKIQSCQKNEAEDLLAQELADNAKYGVEGSPTLLINETLYSGNRTSEDFKQAICSGFNQIPKECETTLESSGGSTPSEGCK